MPFVALTCGLLVVATTVLHYEMLRSLNGRLPALGLPDRAKLVVVILVAFVAHALEIALYGAALHALVAGLGVGGVSGDASPSLASCLYFFSRNLYVAGIR